MVLIWLGVAFFAVIVLVDFLQRRWAKKTLEEFVDRFPDQCGVCAFWRWGVLHGHIDSKDPRPVHECQER